MADKQRSNTSPLHWGLVSKYRNQLFGFAILWIMCMHSREFTPIPDNALLSQSLLYDGIILVGGVGVDMFLFLSGIGLYYALEKKPPLRQFYFRRFHRLLIPYLVIATAFWVFHDLCLTWDPLQFLANLSLLSFFVEGNGLFWYIALMIPLYLAAPWFYHLSQGPYRKQLLAVAFLGCLALNYLFAYCTPTFFDNSEKALTRVFIFILGCYFGVVIAQNRPMSRKWGIFCLLALTCHKFLPALAQASGLMPDTIARRLWHNAAGFALCILLPVLLELLQSDRLNRLLGFFGSISLELYLSHMAFKSAIKALFPEFVHWSALHCIVVYGGVLVAATLFSVLFHRIQPKIESCLTHHITKTKGAFLL